MLCAPQPPHSSVLLLVAGCLLSIVFLTAQSTGDPSGVAPLFEMTRAVSVLVGAPHSSGHQPPRKAVSLEDGAWVEDSHLTRHKEGQEVNGTLPKAQEGGWTDNPP